MLSIKEAVIVEGKYDKIKLSSLLDAIIITTDGFGIFKDREKKELIRSLAEKSGIIILTDSDGAGFKIRNHIRGFVNKGTITNVFIPQIKGKEKRKEKASAEGYLGVEGVSADILKKAFIDAGIITNGEKRTPFLSKQMLFDDGFIGTDNASERRLALLKELGLPTELSTNMIIETLDRMITIEEYKEIVSKIKEKEVK